MHGGGPCMAGGMDGRGAWMAGGSCMAGGHAWQGGMDGRGVCGGGGIHGRGRACHARPPIPRDTVNERVVAHPTGIHSCSLSLLTAPIFIKE